MAAGSRDRAVIAALASRVVAGVTIAASALGVTIARADVERGTLLGTLPATASPRDTPPAGPASSPAAAPAQPAPVLDDRPLTLDDCVRVARSWNLTLKLARGDYRKAQSTHYGSLGRFMPLVSVGARRLNTREDHLGLPGSDGQVTSRSDALVAGLDQLLPIGARVSVTQDLHRDLTPIRTSAFSASVVQPLLRGGGPLATLGPVTSARLDLLSNERALAAADRRTVLETTLAYLAAVRDRSLIHVAESALHADSLLAQVSEGLVDARMATRRDVLSAQLRLADDKASLVGAEKDFALSLDQLKEQMGVPIESTVTLADAELADTTLDLDEDGLVRDALALHPALQSAEAAVRRSEVDLKLARNALLPQVDVVASYTRTLDNDQSAAGLDVNSKGWLASVQVSLPLGNREAQAAADIARFSLDQDRDRLTLLRLQTQRSVRDAVRTLRGIAEELHAIRQTIALAEEKVEFATAMFNLGRANNLDLTDAREALVKGRSNYVSKLADYHAQLAVLKSLTGRELIP